MTDRQKTITHFPKAYPFKRYAGTWSPTFDIISHPDHMQAIVLGCSYNSYKEAWSQAADYVAALQKESGLEII